MSSFLTSKEGLKEGISKSNPTHDQICPLALSFIYDNQYLHHKLLGHNQSDFFLKKSNLTSVYTLKWYPQGKNNYPSETYQPKQTV